MVVCMQTGHQRYTGNGSFVWDVNGKAQDVISIQLIHSVFFFLFFHGGDIKDMYSD